MDPLVVADGGASKEVADEAMSSRRDVAASSLETSLVSRESFGVCTACVVEKSLAEAAIAEYGRRLCLSQQWNLERLTV